MFQAEKLGEDRYNNPIPLSLQCRRRKGRRTEELPQLLSVMSSREKDVKMGVPDAPQAVAVGKHATPQTQDSPKSQTCQDTMISPTYRATLL